MSDDGELLMTIARVKRAMPRNSDVVTIADALEGFLTKPKASVLPTTHVEAPMPSVKPPRKPKAKGEQKQTAGGFSKTEYQREYMRKRRAVEAAKRDARPKRKRQSK